MVDPDARDTVPGTYTTHLVRPIIEKLFKGVATTPSVFEACMYTVSEEIVYVCMCIQMQAIASSTLSSVCMHL